MKKSQVPVTVLFRIFEIILLIMVISIVYLEVDNIQDSRIFQKKFISRDLALTMDSVTNARGNLNYRYQSRELEKFTIDFSGRKINVDGETWDYAVNENLEFAYKKTKPSVMGILITRVGNKLSVLEDEKFNGYLTECPKADLGLNKIILDPGHGYNAVTGEGEKGFAGVFNESEEMLRLGAALDANLKADIKSTRELEIQMLTLPAVGPMPFFAEEAKTAQERVQFIKKNPEYAVISLHAGKNPANLNFAKAYINKDANEETKKIACQILNSVSDEYLNLIKGTAIIPVDLEQLSEDDPRQVLLKERTAVQLEIGNVDEKDNAFLKDTKRLAKTIARGLK